MGEDLGDIKKTAQIAAGAVCRQIKKFSKKTFLHERRRGGQFAEIYPLHRKGLLQPSMETAGQGPYPGNSHSFEEQRRTGASDLARSVAAQNNIPVPGNLVMLLLQLFKRKGQSAGDHKRIG